MTATPPLFLCGDAGTVDAGAEASRGDAVDPGVDVSLLFGKHPATLFLVEKDDRSGGKAFAPRGGRGSLCV